MMFAEAVTTLPPYLTTLLWLAPAPLFIAFALIALGFGKNRALTTATAMIAVLATTLMSFIVFFNVVGYHELGAEPVRSTFNWLATGDTAFKIGVVADPLNAGLMFMVPLACTLIFLYSTNYMASDPRYTRFMGYLSLFAGSMMGLVMSDNLLTLFVFWELMGYCSYSLIGFFYNKPSAYKAAVKAFMTTRVGDMLLMLGMVYLYAETGTLNFFDVTHTPALLEHLANTSSILGLSAAGIIALLIFGGTVGKSAQFPLHVWLPDAMEGPTPVSAMIHAATMVSAGIFLTLRFFPLFQVTGEGSSAFQVVALIGAITAFIGATIAVAQYDIKRVLAYSTISQLGFMVAAIGVGGYIPAAFHLLTHAFFKALLFLGSGSVIHGVEHGHHHLHEAHADDTHDTADTHGTPALHGHTDTDAHGEDTHGMHETTDAQEEFDAQDMRNMGGLRTKMPITFWTFVIGGFALAGFPFITAGFWSKDEIFAEAYHGFTHGIPMAGVVFIVLVLSALLTAFYTMRQISMTFLGQPRTEAAAHASENKWPMTVPLIVLAFFAIVAGFINIPADFPVFGSIMGSAAHWFGHFLGSGLVEEVTTLEFNIVPVLFSLAVALGGLFLGWLAYGRKPLKAGEADPSQVFLSRFKLPTVTDGVLDLFTALNRRLLFDEFYRKYFINPLQAIADNYTRVIDKGIIDSILEGGYRIGGQFAGALKTFDRVVVTGISDRIGDVVRDIGDGGRELQSGQVQNYLLSGIIAAAAILVFFLFIFQ